MEIKKIEQDKVKKSFEKILSFKIDKNWDSINFLKFFYFMNKVYSYDRIIRNLVVNLVYGEVGQTKDEEWFRYVREHMQDRYLDLVKYFEGSEISNGKNYFFESAFENHLLIGGVTYSPLGVKKIHYASPGGIDFFGGGEISSNIIELIKHFIPNKETLLKNKKLKVETNLLKLQAELKKEELFKMRIENFEKLGLSKSQIRILIGKENEMLENLIDIINTEKFTEFELKEEELS